MLRTMANEANSSRPSLRKALGVFDGIAILIGIRAVYQWQNSAVDLVFIVTGIPFAFYWVRRIGKATRMDKKNSDIKI